MSDSGIELSNLLSNSWSILLVIAFFCGAIFFHELGHFLAARWRGLKIERFSIGFGPKLFGWRGKDGVDYRVSLLPLGGYVALPQLADMQAIEGTPEADKEKLPPISYADKMIVAGAGPAFNFILAFVLATIVWFAGYPSRVELQTTEIGYVSPTLPINEETTITGPAYKAGLRAGDKIIAVDGYAVDKWSGIIKYMVTGSGRDTYNNPETHITYERDGVVHEVDVHPALMEINKRSGKAIRAIGIAPAYPLIIGNISPHSPAALADLQVGDRIISAVQQDVYSVPGLNSISKQFAGKPLELSIERDGKVKQVQVVPQAVPITKPLLRIAEPDKKDAYIEIVPAYANAENKDSASLKAPAELMVFQAANIEGFSGVEEGAKIISINGMNVNSLDALKLAIQDNTLDKTLIEVKTYNGSTILNIPTRMTAEVIAPETRSLIGFSITSGKVIIHPDPFTQISNQISMTFVFLKSLFSSGSDIGINQLSGPVGIARVLHSFSLEDLRLAIWFSVLLNINLGVLNLLPIPVLDGGHMLFATIGKLFGRKIPSQIVAGMQGAFMLVLFGLMFYVMFNDSLDWIGDNEAEQRYHNKQIYYIPVNFENNNE